MSADKTPNSDAAFEKMDRMYRYQRYFYDLTRKYYLLGRDRLLNEMKIEDGDRVLEAGCGTGRNLIILAEKHPNAHFFGLDASAEMLKTAQRKIDARGLKNIHLETALADNFAFDKTFDLPQKFDAVFFSYVVSIIPPWQASIENALENLKPGGALYIVDFYDQADLPAWFQKILQSWLRQFHVKYPDNLITFLKDLASREKGRLTVVPVTRRYALIAKLEKGLR
jgi:S-adenosylmethionine-diacylgycerolhomoserine-N-methlytransferase